MIRCIIIDDEPSAISALNILLEKNCKHLVEVVATASNAEEGRKLIETLSPGLVFLDIEMPGMNGVELLRSFDHPTFRVIFVTAYDEYAVEALHLSAVDYLLKPLLAEDLVRAVEKVSYNGGNDNNLESRVIRLEELLAQNPSSIEPRIGIGMADKIVFVNINDILYCEASGSYTNVYLQDGKKMMACRLLADFELQLSMHNFFRIHNSILINMDRVKEYQRHDGGYVIMENGKQLEVSQRRRKDFLEAIHDMIV
ncbi:MAG: LytR/AlgR family response regulator transcription factor [Candidatus Dadabacteria bacterium]